ncbi:transglutaminase-like domain-containing protein [Algoriphagus chordae]|uniref:Transglutaminase superfamily protein n=1 Tax=Algoriphagus chordae TaxID=237019 RepID=A0A2W7RI43_9BACT|nr:transglutaminase domain-containing protein [Algoriphagus chordae]PZX58030.1 transglutaminase superfamily protein [Algoriphagus chordae]
MQILLVVAHMLLGVQAHNDSTYNKNPTPVYSILSENQRIEISDSYEVVHKIERKFTILSSEGLAHAFTSVFYDKLNEIESVEIEITDPVKGKTLERAKTRDMTDAAIYSTSSIFDDNRHKYYEVQSSKFPVQVTVNIETKSSSNFQLSDWVPVHRYNQKVTKSTLTVVYPEKIGLRYKAVNLLGEKSENKVDNRIEMTWVETDLPVQTPDLNKEDDHKLLLAPVGFAMGDYVGKMEDWSGLAAWQYKLNEGRKVLPDAFKTKLVGMVANADTDYEKIQILYEYLQKNYRYVSIQLGIGGWQTMPAEDVVKYAYGDCKGLTNLMQTMLKAVEIPSNYTLVQAGKDADDIETDLPSNQFNHVILQVPMKDGQSPVWLECTSNSLPAGFLGDFTKNRHVLVIAEQGGYLTKTPSYSSFDWNAIHSKNDVKIDKDGNATIATRMKVDGNFAEDLLMVKQHLDTRQQRDYFNRNSPVAGLIINQYELNVDHKDSLLIADLSYEGFIQKFVQNTAKRMILKPFLGKVSEEMLVNNSLSQMDEYQIELPEVMEAENLSEKLVLEEEGITVILKASLEGKNLSVNREINLSLKEDISDEDKTELIKRINALGSTNFYFIKNTAALRHE